jgi:hypothetical protein
MKAIRDLINGNLTDAKNAAKNRSFTAIADSANMEYGMSFQEAHYTAAYLKGEISWTQYCQEKNAVTDAY